MVKIRINTGNLTQIRRIVTKMIDQVDEAQSQVQWAIRNLDDTIADSGNIYGRLNKVRSRLALQRQRLQRYVTALDSAKNSFESTDKKIAKQAKELQYLIDAIANTPLSPTRQTVKISVTTDDISIVAHSFSEGVKRDQLGWDVIKGAGHFGNLVGVMKGGYATEETTDKERVKAIKDAHDLVKDVRSDAKKLEKAKPILTPDQYETAWRKRMFGLNDYYTDIGKASQAKDVSIRWNNNFQKAGAKEISKVSWKSVAVDAAFNAWDNYDEYKSGEITASRAVAETVVETAVDVTVDIVLNAVVAATIATIAGTAGAPVVAVAAATCLLKSGLDAIAKWATDGEKDFTEAASDGFLYIAEEAGKTLTGKNAKANWKKY